MVAEAAWPEWSGSAWTDKDVLGWMMAVAQSEAGNKMFRYKRGQSNKCNKDKIVVILANINRNWVSHYWRMGFNI